MWNRLTYPTARNISKRWECAQNTPKEPTVVYDINENIKLLTLYLITTRVFHELMIKLQSEQDGQPILQSN